MCIRYKCLLCGRDKFIKPTPHNCIGGFRKRGLKWERINEIMDIKNLKIEERVFYKNRSATINKIHNKKVTIKLDCGLYINGYRQVIFCVFPKSLRRV